MAEIHNQNTVKYLNFIKKIRLAKHVLNIADDFNFLLFGIASSDNQYVLVSNINAVLSTDLRLDSYIDLSHRIGKEFKFSFFTFVDEELNLEYNLIPNRSNFIINENTGKESGDLFSLLTENIDESSRLIPELTKTDYLLLIKGDEYYHHSYKVTEALKKIEGIVQIQEIIPDKLASKSNLIF